MKWVAVILAAVLVGVVYGDADSDVEDVPTTEDSTEVTDSEESTVAQMVVHVKNLLQEKCVKNANLEAFQTIMDAVPELRVCLANQLNMTVVEQEMHVVRSGAEFSTITSKYCRKTPLLRECVQNFTATLDPCLDDADKKTMSVLKNLTTTLLQYVCHNDGERINQFVIEGGFQCSANQRQGIEECMEQMGSEEENNQIESITEVLPQMIADECNKLQRLQQCIVEKMELCPGQVPANILRELFQIVTEGTPCANLTNVEEEGESES